MTIYDNASFLKNYLERRNRENSPNNMIELPIIMELIDPVDEGLVLDLGCGDAKFNLDLIKKGYQSYTGVEGSKELYEYALTQIQEEDKIIHSQIEDYEFEHNHYQLVVSRLALHYIKKPQIIFEKVYQSLKAEGSFVFSVHHPVVTSGMETKRSSDKSEMIVKRYFENGERTELWMGHEVSKYHHTIEQYFQFAIDAGFKVEMIKEGKPKLYLFDDQQELKRREQIPLFLMMKLKK